MKTDEQAKEQTATAPDESQRKMQEIMSRLALNLRLADEKLGKRDAGEGTQQTQHDIAKDLEDLIAQAQRSQQQQEHQQQGQAGASAGQSRSRRQARQTQRQTATAPLPDQNQSKATPQSMPLSKEEARRKIEISKIADLYKDIWGHLPETLRQEMDQYSREQFVDKYRDLLKQYYATIAEKGRKKGD